MKTKTEKEVKVELRWNRLEEIAKYYEFPTVVFLSEKSDLTGTRKDSIRKKIEAYRQKINEATDELLEQL